MNLVQEILNNKRSVREIIDEAASVNESPLAALIDAPDQDAADNEVKPLDDAEYRHLFVRRWHEDAEKPYKRAKVGSAEEALNLFFEWVLKYKQDKVEIWSDVSSDAKNFYRFCVKNREMLESLWKNSLRMKKTGTWTGTFRDLQARSRQSGSNLVGTLYPFEAQ